MKKNMQKLLKLLLICLSGMVLVWFMNHDAFLYHDPIARITKVKQGKTVRSEDTYGNADYTTEQTVWMVVENGKYRGQKFKLPNTYSKSGGYDQKYKVNDRVFLIITGSKKITAIISNEKRDTYLVFLCWLVVVLLYATMQFAGLKSILSVLLNFVIFLLFVDLDVRLNLTHFFWLFALAALIFTGLSLFLVIGFNKQFGVTFAAVTSTTVLALVIGVLAMKVTGDQGMHYEALDYATQAPKQLFLAATVIGLLGTVMDAATDIVSTLFEMKENDHYISKRQLFKSGMNVGQAIMGPLVNVLVLIFFAETFMMALLYFRTNNSIAYTFEWTMALGVVQAVISGIGITLTVPLASFLTANVLGGDSHVDA
ncbi:Uncharacterized membrane protein [Ligilactobacillus sp. WC1T17]|uniref:Uncharacterized membrane protein n=1 Tax=Ligilactobacillus ruminis TaxID=1623 RepID=A0ABY1ACP4_9LACO|nr:Uncharacterized membrane protein [Ligilactobacillus ruminis]